MGFYEFEKINFSLIHDGPVYEFLHVLKKSNFHSKSIGVSLQFYQKSPVCGKN
jgi:hypothetical protein